MEVQPGKATKAQDNRLNPQMRRALASFDTLPESAQVPVQVVAALLSVTTPTIWQWAAAGRLPKPQRFGAITRWKVGDVRRALAAKA